MKKFNFCYLINLVKVSGRIGKDYKDFWRVSKDFGWAFFFWARLCDHSRASEVFLTYRFTFGNHWNKCRVWLTDSWSKFKIWFLFSKSSLFKLYIRLVKTSRLKIARWRLVWAFFFWAAVVCVVDDLERFCGLFCVSENPPIKWRVQEKKFQ